MARPATVVCVLVLAVLAGCGGIVGEDTPEPVTPAPVPTTEAPVVDGVTQDAVNASQITANHERALENTSYTMRERIRARGTDGDTQFFLNTTVWKGDDGRFHLVRFEPTQTVSGRINETRIWWDGNRSFFEYAYGTGPDTGFMIRQRAAVDVEQDDTIGRVLAGMRVTRVSRLPDGGAEIAGPITTRSAVPTAGAIDDPRNASLRAQITPEGVVRGLAIGYDGTYQGNRTTVRYRLGFENVGTTTVDRPAWVDD